MWAFSRLWDRGRPCICTWGGRLSQSGRKTAAFSENFSLVEKREEKGAGLTFLHSMGEALVQHAKSWKCSAARATIGMVVALRDRLPLIASVQRLRRDSSSLTQAVNRLRKRVETDLCLAGACDGMRQGHEKIDISQARPSIRFLPKNCSVDLLDPPNTRQPDGNPATEPTDHYPHRTAKKCSQ